MKMKLIPCILVLLSLNILHAQKKESFALGEEKLTFSTSVFQWFHPYSAVFPIGVEAKAFNDIAFYAEYGIPLKSFKASYQNEGKENWHYYKTRLGVRYYFDPFNPYKRRRRRHNYARQEKGYRNYVGIEGFLWSNQYTRKDGSYVIGGSSGIFGGGGRSIGYTHSKIVIGSQGIIFIYGRRYKVGKQMIVGINFGFGRKVINVKHEDVVNDSSGSFGFNYYGGEEYRDGIRTEPYVKIGLDIGFVAF